MKRKEPRRQTAVWRWRKATVKIFDSLYNELPWKTKEQIAALLQIKESAIALEFANFQVKIIILLLFQLLLMLMSPFPTETEKWN